MGTGLLPQICLNRAKVMDDFVDTWKPDHEDAIYACDVEDLTEECMDLHGLAMRTWSQIADALRNNCVRDIQRIGEMLREAVTHHIHFHESIGDHLSNVASLGYTVKGSENFEEVERDVKAFREFIEQQWPWLDKKVARRTQEEFRQGKARPAKDFLNELRRSSIS